MGSSQSTRKITVSNESAHIIKVSDSVIDRLTNVGDGTSTPNRRPTTSTPVAPQISPSTTSNAAAPVTYGGSLTSLQVFQEKEKQLQENDAYWAKRVNMLEDSRTQTARLMEQEFTNTVRSLESRVPKRQLKLAEAPCEDKKTKVLECYRQNPKQILLCSKEVAEFANCVDLKRLTAA